MSLPLARLSSWCRSRTRFAPSNALKTAYKTTKTKSTTNRTIAQTPAPISETSVSPLQYLITAGVAASAGLALTVAPSSVWEALGSSDVVNVTETSTQVYGVYWLLVATASYRLSKASEKGILSSSTYQRLNAFLGLFAAASAVPLLQGAATGELSTVPAGAAAAALLLSAAGTYLPGYLASSGSTDVAELASGVGNGLKSTFKAGRGLLGAFYSLNFWEDFILGIALLGGPILPTIAGGISGTTVLAKDLVGVGTLLYAGLVWMLLDAADRGRLGAATFRALNAACGGVSVLVGAVCVAGQANGIATNQTNQTVVLVSCLLTAAVFLYQSAKPAGNE